MKRIAKIKVFGQHENHAAHDYGTGAVMVIDGAVAIGLPGGKMGVALESQWDADTQTIRGDILEGRIGDHKGDGEVKDGWLLQ